MSCSCRATPWRIFVQGLSQVHRVDAAPLTRSIPFASTLRQHAAVQATSIAAPPQGRRFHTVKGHMQGLENTAAAVQRVAGDEVPTATSHDVLSSSQRDMGEKKPQPQSQHQPQVRRQLRAPRRKDVTVEGGPALEMAASDSQPNIKQRRKAQANVPPLVEMGKSEPIKTEREKWQTQKAALKEKFPEGWKPRKRLSPDALAGIRALNAQFPDVYTTEALADKFQVSAEAIRRILKSKWQPSVEEETDRQERWFKRGIQVWERQAALGIKPPRKWRREGIVRDPEYHEKTRKASERERLWEDKENKKYSEHRARTRRAGGP
ncbi:hypothetical protein DCS_02327 [Drechmeria coniospora]|uniref:Required for respiratory growth protein 9, mitochondrial n=1 Tax=Drechmeria coniospora TaxID=98403 RepID=A0A151GVQ4_DRECN|nr:hypothetical protein DCS_02327 [Drechmeria coniospora]KYK61186.1 hypothetical protein DCS_02327 [Drechmeria coniospora]ODA80951.1 hypothetical protein RJ55_03911 [Drechmeria coniospora]